jgi:hypothetical protein
VGHSGFRSCRGCGVSQDGCRFREDHGQQARLQHPAVPGPQSEDNCCVDSGDVPDLVFHDAPATLLPQNAWDDKLLDVSDVVEAQKSQLSETAVASSTYYNNATRRRSYYLAPIKQVCIPFHIWGSLVEKAGFKLSDAPNTWDAFHDFFKPVQDSLRKNGMRKIYAMGMSLTTVGPNDGNGLFTTLSSPTGARTSSRLMESCTRTIRRYGRLISNR